MLALVFLAGWSLMTVAMTLPTSIPLLGVFPRVARSRPDRPLLIALVVIGYLLVWTAVGAVTYIGFRGLLEGAGVRVGPDTVPSAEC